MAQSNLDDFEMLVHLFREYMKSQCCGQHAGIKIVYAFCAACATFELDASPFAKLLMDEAKSLQQELVQMKETIQ